MKISLEWLRDYVEVPTNLTISEVMHALTLATVEVEGAEQIASRLANIVVGRVLDCTPMEGSRKLSLTHCDVGGDQPLQILCGAKNVASGMMVPVALANAQIIPHGKSKPLTVSNVTIAGTVSEGVICSAEELRLSDLFPEEKEGILHLRGFDKALGSTMAELLGWNDHILDIDNKSLTNRPDLWGHYGIARELSAIFNVPLKELPDFDLSAVPEMSLLDIENTPGNNRVTATRIEGVIQNRAPFWIRSRLASVGQRSINLLVDLTNYVMLTTGQPCHVYDLEKLSMPLKVRRMQKGEQCLTLDNTVVEGDELTLAVADEKGLVALAGIIGGIESSVGDDTTSALLEVASFEAMEVRRTSMRLAIRTDASARFEKAIDTQRVDQTRALFLRLLKKIIPDARITARQDHYPHVTQQQVIDTSVTFLHEQLGKSLPAEEICQSLASLGILTEMDNDGSIRATIPTWRSTGDITLPHDLIEEVARLHGYDNFNFTPPKISLKNKAISSKTGVERRFKEFFATVGGMREVVSYPWAKDSLIDAAGFDGDDIPRIAGAPAPDQEQLRPSLLPNLLNFAALNLRNLSSFGMFETGKAFSASSSGIGINEDRRIAGILVGNDAEAMFLELKGLVLSSARVCQVSPIVIATKCNVPWADPYGRVGLAVTNSKVHHIGGLGVVSTRAMRIAGIKHAQLVAFEFSLDRLTSLLSRENHYQPLPELPHVVNDLSLVMDESVPWSQLEDVSKSCHELIREVDFVDQYRGKGIEAGQKSITLRLTLGADHRTLDSEDIVEVRATVLTALEKAVGSKLRG